MSKHTDNQAPSTEERILAAAAREFFTKGFAGARTTTIAEAAGVTHAMLHYYFRTKEKLFHKLMEEKSALVRKLINDAFADDDMPLLDSLKRCIEMHLDIVAANPEMPRFLVTEVLGNPEHQTLWVENLKYLAPNIEKIQQKIDEGVDRGEFRYVDARTLMIDLLSLNVFSFLMRPMLDTIMGPLMDDIDGFVEQRKKENFDTITRKLKI